MTEHEELLKRLERKNGFKSINGGEIWELANPDGPEAAALIRQQASTISRLVEDRDKAWRKNQIENKEDGHWQLRQHLLQIADRVTHATDSDYIQMACDLIFNQAKELHALTRPTPAHENG